MKNSSRAGSSILIHRASSKSHNHPCLPWYKVYNVVCPVGVGAIKSPRSHPRRPEVTGSRHERRSASRTRETLENRAAAFTSLAPVDPRIATSLNRPFPVLFWPLARLEVFCVSRKTCCKNRFLLLDCPRSILGEDRDPEPLDPTWIPSPTARFLW